MDFSTEALYALEVARQISNNYFKVEIMLVNIIDAPTQSTFSATGEYVALTMDDLYVLKLIEKTKIEMDEIMNDPRYEDLDIKERIKVGSRFNFIAEEITSIPADLIIIGSKGARGMEELLKETTAEKVVRYAACPVITIKVKPDNFKVADIIFASSFKEEIFSIEKLLDIQKLFSAKIHLLYVNTSKDQSAAEKAKSRMHNFAERINLREFSINVYNSSSNEKGITEFAQQINADVISMATHARKGFFHLIIGSLTEDMVNHSKKMMLTFHMKEETV